MATVANTVGELLTRRQTAEMLAISVSTLDRWAATGIGPKPIRLHDSPREVTARIGKGKRPVTTHRNGGPLRYSRPEVEQWLASRIPEPAGS